LSTVFAAAARRPYAGADFQTLWNEADSGHQTDRRMNAIKLCPGAGTPLFLVHWGSGNIAFVRDVAAHFHHGHPVYGFEAAGLWRDGRPLLSVTAMAQRYLREIKAIQPTGPYLVGGLCSGSQIAYEIATLLEDSGEHVGPVTLVNAARGELASEPLLDVEDQYELRLAALRRQFGIADLEAELDQVLGAMRRLRWIDDGMPAEDFFWRQVLSAASAYAFRRCTLRPHQGDVKVFVARMSVADPEVRWRDIAPNSTVEPMDAETSSQIMSHPVFVEAMRQTFADIA